MNKLFLTIITVLYISVGFSQDNQINNKKLLFGVLGGINASSITNEGAGENFSSRIGLRAGVFTKLNLNDKFALNIKAIYSGQGNKYEQTITDLELTDPSDPFFGESGSFEGKNKLNYIQIPVTAAYRVGKFSFELGPQVGFNVGAKTTTEMSNSSQEYEIANEQSVVFGGIVGVNAYITNTFFITLAYERGFSKLFRDVQVDGIGRITSDYKYSVFSLSANYIIF